MWRIEGEDVAALDGRAWRLGVAGSDEEEDEEEEEEEPLCWCWCCTCCCPD